MWCIIAKQYTKSLSISLSLRHKRWRQEGNYVTQEMLVAMGTEPELKCWY